MTGRPTEEARAAEYDPFARGRYPVGVRTVHALDTARDRCFPCEVWYPAAAQHAGQDLERVTQDSFSLPPRHQQAVRDATAESGPWPLIAFSHSSGGGRRQSTFLCTHLSSHGYVVAALDHSEVVAQELARGEDETETEKAARQEAWVANRVPDVRFLIDQVLEDAACDVDPERIGIVGHSFGGWTALAAPDVEARIGAVVALAPAGSSQPQPGMLQAQLAFAWDRDVPTLYLVAADDVSMPLAGMVELFDRTPARKQMVVLQRADHMHFMDDVATLHEAVRGMTFPDELAWVPQKMQPFDALCSEEHAQLFVRGLTVCHLDAVLGGVEAARQLLLGPIEARLVELRVDALVHRA